MLRKTFYIDGLFFWLLTAASSAIETILVGRWVSIRPREAVSSPRRDGHGPYVSHNGIYAKIPDDKTPKTITLKEAVSPCCSARQFG